MNTHLRRTIARTEFIVDDAWEFCPWFDRALFPPGDSAIRKAQILVDDTSRSATLESESLVHHGRTFVGVTGEGYWLRFESFYAAVQDGVARVCGVVEDDDAHEFVTQTLYVLLAVILRSVSVFHVHGALLVSPNGQGVLLVGDANIGKSTTALALVKAGWDWLGDDFLSVEADQDEVRWYGLRRPFRIRPRTARAHGMGAGTEVVFYDPREAARGVHREEFSGALTVLDGSIVDRDESVFEPGESARSLGGLVTGSAWVMVPKLGKHAEHLRALREIVGRSTPLRVHLGRDVLNAPASFADRLSRALESTA